MRRIFGALAAATTLLLAAVATPSQAQNIGLVCTSDNTPADKQIAACSKIIGMKALSGDKLATIYFWRAVGYNKKGGYANVINDTTEAIRLQPNQQALYNLRGSAYFDKGEYDIAIADLSDALRLGPPNGTIYHNRGNAYLGKKDFAHAIADYDQAIKLSPSAFSYQNRGVAKEALGNLDGGLEDIDNAIRLDPKLPSPLIFRSVLWRAKNDYDHAVADAEQAIELANSGVPVPIMTPPGSWLVNSYLSRGLAYEAKGDIDRAKTDFTAVLAVKVADAASKANQATAKARLAVLSKTDALPPRPATNAADGGRRIALVIGNGAYAHVTSLPNPPNDAHAVAGALKSLGFEVTEGIDADHDTLQRLTREFLFNATGAKIALLYYAGHGVQIDGHNFLVPVDLQKDSVANLVTEITDMDTILAGLDDQVRTNILIFDACRNNPFGPQQTAEAMAAGRSISVAPGLASPSSLGPGATAGAGTLIAFATAPGQIALDGDNGDSPFSSALARYMGVRGLEVQQMLTRVRADVVGATQGKQVPWSNSSLLGEVYLAGGKR